MIKVKAIFKGENNSCGYKTNMEYSLLIQHKKGLDIEIETLSGQNRCPYNSIISFIENWDNIRKI